MTANERLAVERLTSARKCVIAARENHRLARERCERDISEAALREIDRAANMLAKAEDEIRFARMAYGVALSFVDVAAGEVAA